MNGTNIGKIHALTELTGEFRGNFNLKLNIFVRHRKATLVSTFIEFKFLSSETLINAICP